MSLSSRRPIFVILAVFRPNETHLAEQIASLAAQTYPVQKVIAVIADKTSGELVSERCAHHGLDLATVVPLNETDSYASFELGLRRAVELAPENGMFALCDQDDVWHKDKLLLSAEAIAVPGVEMVHTDAELVDERGERLHKSMHRFERRLPNATVRNLLLENTVTGMTTLMTRRVVEAALPFPTQSALYFHHDLWIALVASMCGKTAFVDKPLVAYRQHSGNVVGMNVRKEAAPKIATHAWMRHWASRYAVAVYLAKSLYLRASELAKISEGAFPNRNRLQALSPYLAVRGTGTSLLGDAIAHGLLGRFRLAKDSAMHAAVQAGRLALAVRRVLREGTLAELSAFDAKLFAAAPGVQPGFIAAAEPEPSRKTISAASVEDRRTIRRFDIEFRHVDRPRMVILVPTLNPPEIFAGIATAIDIGAGLADRGHDVLFLATDLPVANRDISVAFIEKRRRNGRGSVDVVCGRRRDTVALTSQDVFLATAWWTAHLAKGILADRSFMMRQFYYLIQDYEPGFYAWGAEYAGARESYDFDYIPIFNCQPLKQHFDELGHGAQNDVGLTFRPSIDLDRYLSVPRVRNAVPKLAVYGRPRVERNLFPVCISSLQRFLNARDIAPGEIDLVSVGQDHPDVTFSGGHMLRSLGKIPWEAYPEFLGSVDIGLSLMHSPHPSHPPLEMAAAGARVVTNDYGGKSLGPISPAIHAVQPTVAAVADALCVAWDAGRLRPQDRRVNMKALGLPLSQVIDRLSSNLSEAQPMLAEAG